MTPIERVEEIAFDPSLTVADRSQSIIQYFSAQGGQGPDRAVDCLLETIDEAVAEYVAEYLELVPDVAEGKIRAAERLRGAGPVVRAAGRLVPWLPESLTAAFVEDYLAAPDPESPLSSVIFNIGVYHPDRLRPYEERLDTPLHRSSLLSGAPDSVADSLLREWRESREMGSLVALALIRTPHAADLITSVRDEVDTPEQWEVLMPLAGRLPDTGNPAGFHPAFMGFVTDQGKSPHVMGGRYEQDVPLCARCGMPADRVLTLSSRELPYELGADPSFFWFSCDCDEVDILYVQFAEDGTHAFYQPQGPSAEKSRVVPGERAMVLETHPNQTGVSRPAVTGRARHQVGGLPRWPSPETHALCPGCGNFMPFLVAVDSGPTPFGPLGFEGSLFGFWCDRCSISATRSQP
ncbi:hypothetical protein HZZ00_16095 [Streptomyces sp. NEAU-sy36]|uniref:hypothetical protein n=1 Tax=unclassified Streptomyces TaxID=2593676 RepID=UPI0015D627F4|nr:MULTISPECIES: hypothetical protein [unclassified Streptomyces]QLJ02400.1 hypothetical protein HZZ00_16095 [Streptomyces sp. NEAU-sy36]